MEMATETETAAMTMTTQATMMTIVGAGV
jgi:hypothetical protein